MVPSKEFQTPKGEIALSLESASDVLAKELLPMQQQQFEEVDPLSFAGYHFRPDVDWYLQRAQQGRLGVIVARNEGRAIGYLIFRIDRSPVTGLNAATEELWYIIPAFRGTAIALKMIEYFEAIARHLGLAELYMGYSKKSASALYERAGMQLLAVMYGKVLTDENAKVA